MRHWLTRILYAVGLVVVCLLPLHTAWSLQNVPGQKQQLLGIRDEIRKYESALSRRQKDEKQTLEFLSKLDREIDLAASYLRSLSRDVGRLESQLVSREQRIRDLSREKDRLQALIKKRMVYFYKHRRAHDIDLLLNVKSMQQFRVWLRYQKMITDNDRRNLQALMSRQKELEKQQNYLRLERAEKSQKAAERHLEEVQLRSSREKRSKYLTDVRKDKKLLEQRLRESRESEKQILALIAKAEQARLTQAARKPQNEPAPKRQTGRAHTFAALKGKLVWPAQGQVIGRFGRHRHPELNTITENLGIEIKAALGSPVVTVGDGMVQAITWQRGSGNIVLISHEDGYYTVYTHLQEIRVAQNEAVRQGQVIGSVGESGSAHGAVLHFQIWKNTRNLDPEEWLT